jgi:predicted SnoaL-like aldol condensation-catalyzing enzyme
MSPIKMHKIESGIRLVVELYNGINNHKVEDIIDFLCNDCILESASSTPYGNVYKGKDQIRKYYENLFKERKEVRYKTEEIMGFGHLCIIRWECIWVNRVGTKETIRGVDIIKEKNDFIYEILSYIKCTEID